jgi:drug/metabolite transporter (DMT)-like permease
MCALLWSTSGLFIKLLDWHPLLITGGRGLFAAVILFVYRVTNIHRHPNEQFHFSANFVIAGVSYAVTLLLFVYANKMTTSANAIMLEYTAPVWAALIGWAAAKEKPRPENWFSIGAMCVGFVIFFRDGLSTGRIAGDALALVAGIFFGSHSVFMRLQKKEHPLDSLLLSHILCFVVSIPLLIKSPPSFTPVNILAVIFMGTVQIGLSSFFFSYGIQRISGMSAMLTAAIEPALNPVWVFLFTGEKPGASAIIGGAIIISAIISSSWLRWRALKKFYARVIRRKRRIVNSGQ